MSFLAPWFLLGAAAIAGPVIFHLIRRATRNKIQFSATEFLDPSPPRLQKRNTLQHPLLLLLRCLVIALLAFGFSRPFLKKDIPLIQETAQDRHTVLILDESASMRRAGQWEAAKSQLLNWVSESGLDHQLSILGVADQVSHILPGELWEKTPSAERIPLVRALLEDRQPGWGATYLDLGLDAALDELEQLAETSNAGAQKSIRVFSDLTSGTRLSGLAGRDWPEGCVVEFEPTVGGESKNVGMQWLGWSKLGDGPLKARLSLTTTGENQTVKLSMKDAVTSTPLGEPQTVYSQIKDKRLFLLELPEGHSNPFTIILEGDSEPFDNTLYVAPKNVLQATLPFLGDQPSDDPKGARFYLERATLGWEDPRISIERADTSWDETSDSLLVIHETPDRETTEKIKAFLSRGGAALFLFTETAQLSFLENLSGESGWQSPALKRNYGLLGSIDFEHPVFKIFADPRYNNFSNIRFWQARPLVLPDDSQARILARFDEGPVAILELKVGDGSMIVWGGDWTPDASQWVLSSKFVPWFQQWVEQSLGGPARPTMGYVQAWQDLVGKNAEWSAFSTGMVSENAPQAPGLYQVSNDNNIHWIALNIPYDESRIDALPWDTWEKLGVPLEAKSLIVSEEIFEKQMTAKNAVELESEQKLWRWLLLGTALFLAAESLLSITISRKGAVPAEA